MVCSSSTCQCSGNGGTPQATESSCGDNHDNDCDGQTDCADSDCNGDPCGSNGMVCSSSTCQCSGNGGTPQATETTCNDDNDNDCDGLTDCQDPHCDGKQCAPSKTCQSGVCS
ncbi:MAG: hypothetical protein RBU30_23940 [Polyangia bacterium]|nr:hypothetical protein [Polyangia bacterium]